MTTSALKIIAVVTMLIDHVGEFIPGTPIWLRWIGRLSAPIFVFCMTEGVRHTSNRRLYLLRLYGFSAGMGLMNFALNSIFPDAPVYLSNNIFTTLFLASGIIMLIEVLRRPNGEKWKNVGLVAVLVVSQILVEPFLPTIIAGYGENAARLIFALIPQILFTEGGIAFVLFGVIQYFLAADVARGKKLHFALFYCFFSIYMCIGGGLSLSQLFTQNYQWMMLASLPLLLCYNGEQGGETAPLAKVAVKYFFYLFYPLHIAALFVASNFAT